MDLAWQRLADDPAPMPGFTEKQIEAEARRIIRAKIKRMPWQTGLPPEERKRRIEADVDRWWHLEISEAAQRLKEQSEE